MESLQASQSVYDSRIEKIRHLEYPALLNTTYLDHAGTTLYASSLIDAFHHDLKSNLYGNPHSDSPASDASTQRVDGARLSVLRYFNADPDHFDVVFTANATAAVKLVADCFRDQKFWYGYHKDVHSSIVGVREVAEVGSECFASNEQVSHWIDQRSRSPEPTHLTLFAYPAQSNMTGYRLPHTWAAQIRNARAEAAEMQRTYVLLDAASYLTTGRLDLNDHDAAPDFIALSFYKIFGFPDLGALIVRKAAQQVLTRRKYFGGGTVDSVTVFGPTFHAKRTTTIHDYLEDGTVPFHNICALTHAISTHERLFGSAQAISNHVSALSAWLFNRLSALKHHNDHPVLRAHKDASSTYGDAKTQGPILAFSILRSNGSFVGKSHFERLAIDCGFQLRTGGVCNPGGIASMLDLKHWEMRRNLTEGAKCGGEIDVIGAKPTGIIRVSLGPMSTLKDVSRFAEFVEFFFVERSESCLTNTLQCHQSEARHEGIAPIEGFPAMHLAESEDIQAYKVWDGQWCIVECQSGAWKMCRLSEASSTVKCSLEPEEGRLRLSQKDKSDLFVSLWDRPERVSSSMLCPHTGAFDIYRDESVTNWLTQALGTSCSLARYRTEHVTLLPENRTCVISTCAIQCDSRAQLHMHYKVHARKFLKTHGFETRKHNSFHGSIDKEKPPGHVRSRLSWSKKQPFVIFSVTQVTTTTATEGPVRVDTIENANQETAAKVGKRMGFRRSIQGTFAKIFA